MKISPMIKIISMLLIFLIFSMPFTLAAEMLLTYDANGNLVTGDGKFRTYNSLNQLWRIYNGSNTSMLLEEYTYHPVEERVAIKKVYNSSGSIVETTYYFSKEFVRVINTSGTFNFTYVYQDGLLVAQDADGVKTFFVNDLKGNIVATLNSTGGVIDSNQYSPTGEILSSNNKSRYQYEGKEFDKTTGQTDYNFRLYNANNYIYGQPDPLISNLFNSQSLNRYMFESGNPYKNIDPTGHDAVIVNYDIGGKSSGMDYGHSSVVVGNDEEGWTAMWYGTSEPEEYEGGLSTIFKDTKPQVFTGKGSTWQGAIKDMENSVPSGSSIGPHDTSTAVTFKSSSKQDSQMKSYIGQVAEGKKDTKYSPAKNNCANEAANVLAAGGIKTQKTLLPNNYRKGAQVSAAINNIMYKAKTFINNLFSKSKKSTY